MNIMKKRLLYTAATFITVLCSACSNQTSPAEENEITVNDSIVDTENAHEPIVITQETDEADKQEDTRQNTQNNQNAETTDNTTASQNDENYDSVSAQITFLTHEELASQFSANEYIFYWAQCFLYDMDTEDDTIEVAFQMNYREEHILTPHTFLYRYQKNGLFTFLGKIEGTVTDPAFSPEKLLIH